MRSAGKSAGHQRPQLPQTELQRLTQTGDDGHRTHDVRMLRMRIPRNTQPKVILIILSIHLNVVYNQADYMPTQPPLLIILLLLCLSAESLKPKLKGLIPATAGSFQQTGSE
jgi:hypothetical protein